MIDHIILTVSDVERSLAFYEASLAPLNIRFFLPHKGENGHPDLWGFGDGKRAFFWLKQGKPDPRSIHWGFMAENNAKVDEFYQRTTLPMLPGTAKPPRMVKNSRQEWAVVTKAPPAYFCRWAAWAS
jgi:catechol 2,3-dioxygenase-like lactoylglutathione lyase family enzyme